MNLLDPKNATPEQKKEIGKILSKARLRLFGIMAKFSIGLFGANLVALTVGTAFLKDSDPSIQVGFQIVAFFINFLFMIVYLAGRLGENRVTLEEEIKKVLKNNN